jgi:hypothetical protein
MEQTAHMDPLILNRLELELTFFAVFVLFAVVALLVVARKATNTRQVVLSGDMAASNAVLDEIARTAQARIGTLPMAAPFHFSPAEKSSQAMIDVPGGPVIVNGSKYLLESSWTHLPTFEQGREGEERVVNSLVNSLGQGWYIFRNFVLPTKEDDIDVVLVGPGGIYAIEVKNYVGNANFERSRCYVKTPQGKFYRQRRHADSATTRTSLHLDTFFNDHGLGTHSKVKRLAVVSDSNIENAASSSADVCTVEGLKLRMRTIAGSRVLSAGQVGRVVSVLKAEASSQMMRASSRVH